jgi:hypothetical protein
MGQAWHQLLRREVCELRTSHEAHDLGLFSEHQGIFRAVVRSTSTVVVLGMRAPSLDGPSRDVGHSTRLP